MAKEIGVTKTRATSLLNSIGEFWEGLPSVSEEIETWDVILREDYLMDEIPSNKRLMEELEKLRSSGAFTQEEERRYQVLKKLQADNEKYLTLIYELFK